MKKVIISKQLLGVEIVVGELIDTPVYRSARVGYGYEQTGEDVKGVIVRVINPNIKAHGCSMTWAEVEIGVME